MGYREKLIEYYMKHRQTKDLPDAEFTQETADHVEALLLKKLSSLYTTKRKEAKITVRELNKRSHVSLAVITDLENARSMPRVETLVRLAVALGIDFNEVFEAMKIPYKKDANIQKTSQSDIATAIASFGYDKNQVQEIIEFIKFIDYKNSDDK